MLKLVNPMIVIFFLLFFTFILNVYFLQKCLRLFDACQIEFPKVLEKMKDINKTKIPLYLNE